MTTLSIRHAFALALILAWAPALSAFSASSPSSPRSSPDEQARQILEATGVQGGLIVHLGCGDGTLTAALRAGDSYLVQGLDSDAENVSKARRHIQSLGLYGSVSVDRLGEDAGGKRLPYVDNLVNLVVAESLGRVPMEEVMRVLCPNGVAYVNEGGTWTKTVKPRPAEIDEWTHYLYDASGNAVSHDEAVGPPRHFQWNGSPRWSRHHDRRASTSAMVSSGGRIFYIFDEGSTASVMLPAKPVLVARDAFNGTILWKRPIPHWFPYLWPFKSGPTQLQRRLVAVGDRVYVTLGLDAPLTALDAATGKTVRTYEGSFATEEALASDGVLFLLVNESPQVYDNFRPEEVGIGVERDRVMRDWPWNEKPRHLVAVQADTGKMLWKADRRVVPLTLAADQRRIYFHDGERLVALNRKTGEEVWKSPPVERLESIPVNIMPTLVVYQDVVLFYGAKTNLTGVSAATGEILWTAPEPKSGHFCPEDVLVAGGLVWGGEIAGGNQSGVFTGRDPKTGEVKSEFPPDTDIYFMHQRCYRSKATDRYLLPSRTGIEFIDFRNEHWITNHWVRGGCIYGIMPANGLVYTPAHDCACYMQAKLYGFCALTPESASLQVPRDVPDKGRLEKGPAYDAQGTGSRGQGTGLSTLNPQPSTLNSSSDWPTYRHDAARSGSTDAAVPANLKPAWSTPLGGRLSSVVIAGGKLFLAAVDAHTVHALDAASGKPLWSYTAGGRIDSPPTILCEEGRVLFGSADGYVYCLRASDGALAWRFRAAPEDRRMTAFEQIESVWPVSGSVLVQGGVVYCVAGRSMFLDGGLRYLRLDARTGRKLGETIFDENDPANGENLQQYVEVRNMPVGLPDVLSSDGRSLYMRSLQFDLEGNRSSLEQVKGSDVDRAALQQGEGVHLFSPTGFLDDSWWHRSYWVYGRSFSEGAGGWPQAGKVAPGGRILAFDKDAVYGFGRKPEYYQWRTPLEYHLFAADRQPEIVREPAAPPGGVRRAAPNAGGAAPNAKAASPTAKAKAAKAKRPAGRRLEHPQYRWSCSVPLEVRAMALAGDVLFLAGPPDVVDEEEAFRRFGDPEIEAKLAEQDAALAGKEGAVLWAVSTGDGRKLADYPLDSLPVFDSLIAAGGRLYLATTDGRVLCFRGSE